MLFLTFFISIVPYFCGFTAYIWRLNQCFNTGMLLENSLFMYFVLNVINNHRSYVLAINFKFSFSFFLILRYLKHCYCWLKNVDGIRIWNLLRGVRYTVELVKRRTFWKSKFMFIMLYDKSVHYWSFFKKNCLFKRAVVDFISLARASHRRFRILNCFKKC